MASVRSIVNRLRGIFRRNKPEAPRLPTMPGLGDKRPGKVVGHRGVATGILQETDEAHEILQPSEVEEFVYKERILYVHSSNVNTAQYFIDTQKLILTYLNGGVYEYGNISEQEAINFAQAFSKGKWTWDSLRVRGSRTAHKKPFRRIK